MCDSPRSIVVSQRQSLEAAIRLIEERYVSSEPTTLSQLLGLNTIVDRFEWMAWIADKVAGIGFLTYIATYKITPTNFFGGLQDLLTFKAWSELMLDRGTLIVSAL